ITASSSGVSESSVPLASVTPRTMCPDSRSAGRTERSRFTGSPGFSSPRLERRYVSGMQLKWSVSPSMCVTVRSTPFTAMESPGAVPSSTFSQAMTSRPRSASRTAPTSSMMPVNIGVRTWVLEPRTQALLHHAGVVPRFLAQPASLGRDLADVVEVVRARPQEGVAQGQARLPQLLERAVVRYHDIQIAVAERLEVCARRLPDLTHG